MEDPSVVRALLTILHMKMVERALLRSSGLSASLLELATGGFPFPTLEVSKLTIVRGASKVGSEPLAVVAFSRCARSQHKRCSMSENNHAVAQREERPLVWLAA